MFGRRKVAKHFNVTITDDTFSFVRNQAAIASEAALDGIYVVRTNLPAAQSDAAATVRAYKCPSGIKLSRESRLADWPCAARGGCESLLSAEVVEALDVDDREPHPNMTGAACATRAI